MLNRLFAALYLSARCTQTVISEPERRVKRVRLVSKRRKHECMRTMVLLQRGQEDGDGTRTRGICLWTARAVIEILMLLHCADDDVTWMNFLIKFNNSKKMKSFKLSKFRLLDVPYFCFLTISADSCRSRRWKLTGPDLPRTTFDWASSRRYIPSSKQRSTTAITTAEST